MRNFTWSSHAWTPWGASAVAIWTGEDFGTDFVADVAALFEVLAALFVTPEQQRLVRRLDLLIQEAIPDAVVPDS